jgi:uncharacterized protein YhfF
MAAGLRSELTEQFWREFREATDLTETRYDVVAFGDNPAMATDLAELVVARTKRATAGLVQQFGHGKEPPPIVGGYFIVVDGHHQPRAICQTTDIRIGPLSSVSESFAWDEGEGERTRGWWLSAHRTYFAKRAHAEGFQMHDEIETVFERFTMVWSV